MYCRSIWERLAADDVDSQKGYLGFYAKTFLFLICYLVKFAISKKKTCIRPLIWWDLKRLIRILDLQCQSNQVKSTERMFRLYFDSLLSKLCTQLRWSFRLCSIELLLVIEILWGFRACWCGSMGEWFLILGWIELRRSSNNSTGGASRSCATRAQNVGHARLFSLSRSTPTYSLGHLFKTFLWWFVFL